MGGRITHARLVLKKTARTVTELSKLYFSETSPVVTTAQLVTFGTVRPRPHRQVTATDTRSLTVSVRPHVDVLRRERPGSRFKC